MNGSLQDIQPKPSLGMIVRFYPQASMDESRVEIGAVTKIGQSTISICIFSTNSMRSSVKHKDDPRLAKSIDQRQYGCWDFTEEWYEKMSADEYTLETLAQIDDRLRSIAKALELPALAGANPQASANRIKAENFGRLRRRATELGVQNVVFLSSAQLQDEIQRAEDRLVAAQQEIEESRKKARGQSDDEEMSEEDRRREILARAQNNPEAVNLARRQASVANSDRNEDNRKPPELSLKPSKAEKKSQSATSAAAVPATAGHEDL